MDNPHGTNTLTQTHSHTHTHTHTHTHETKGFHNYLFYSGKLSEINGAEKTRVWKQGTGAVNNLATLRGVSLRERSILDQQDRVLNWDGTVSRVVHQYDRDDELKAILKKRTTVMEKAEKQNGLSG